MMGLMSGLNWVGKVVNIRHLIWGLIAYQQILVEKNKATAQALSSRPQNGRFGNPQRPLGFEPWYSSQRGRRPQ